MKWTNKGHQFDLLYDDYEKGGKTHRMFAIFGCGKIGKFYGKALEKFGVLDGCYDSFIQGDFYGHIVKSPALYEGNEILVLCASDKNIESMSDYLIERGFIRNRDFWDYREFFDKYFPIVMLYEHQKLYSDMIQLSITERCILKCKKCAHGCNFVPFDSEDISVEDLMLSIDNYFLNIDFVQYFLIIGGEPMIYKNKHDVIEYIGKKYRDRIGKLQITTNGLVKPDDRFVEICKEFSVNFRISNYMKAIPNIKETVESTIDILYRNDIEYTLVPEDQNWMDYGFDHVDRKGNNLINVFDDCLTQCHEIRRNKLYFCIMARSINDNMMRNIGEDDYLLLVNHKGELTAPKCVIMEFLHGYSDKGYLEMCNYCYGKERIKYRIPVAEQEKRRAED